MIVFYYQGRRRKKKLNWKKTSTDSSPSTSSRLSTIEIQGIVEQLKHQQYRSSTRKTYYSVWKSFNQFFVRLDFKPKKWRDRLTLFVGYLIQNKKQSSTVKSYISAIKAVLKENNIKISQDEYLLASLVRACKLKNDKIQTRLPLQKGMLAMVIKRVQDYYDRRNQPYLKSLFCAMISSMYFGPLRISEVTVADGHHPIQARDVQVGTNKRKFMFLLRTSKTHWTNSKHRS